jgi:hypothetical protein
MRRLAGGEELYEGVKVKAFDQVRDVKYLGTHNPRLAPHAGLLSSKRLCRLDTPRLRWGKEKRLMRWVEAAMERVAATISGGGQFLQQSYLWGLASSISAVTEAQDKTYYGEHVMVDI